MSPLVLAEKIAVWAYLGRRPVDVLEGPVSGKKTCPSYPDRSSGTELGVRLSDGSFHFAPDDQFVQGAVDVESERFYGPCLNRRCSYWSGNCQLGAKIAEVVVEQDGIDSARDHGAECPIRMTCRWRAENGKAVCGGCSSVDYRGTIDLKTMSRLLKEV